MCLSVINAFQLLTGLTDLNQILYTSPGPWERPITIIKNRKIKNRKIGKKSEKRKNGKIEIFQKSGPNQGANERPKGEPVAVGNLKASF